jgi:hypothetical protein
MFCFVEEKLRNRKQMFTTLPVVNGCIPGDSLLSSFTLYMFELSTGLWGEHQVVNPREVVFFGLFKAHGDINRPRVDNFRCLHRMQETIVYCINERLWTVALHSHVYTMLLMPCNTIRILLYKEWNFGF